MYDHILIRYGELALKGKNQKQFLKTLVRNVKNQIKLDTGEACEIKDIHGRIILPLNGKEPEYFYPSLDRVFGLASYSPVRSTELSEDAIIQTAVEEMKRFSNQEKTFRVTVKRANKRFPIRSMDMQLLVAERILDEVPGLEGDLRNYDIELNIDIRFDQAYVYVDKFKGLGGLPLGTGGRAVALLSGGIDSPVAMWSIMRRGVVVEAIHFHSYPYTSQQAEDKVLALAEKVAKYGGQVNVHLVPFTRIQEAIGMNCFENLRITIMRRIMIRIAERIATIRNAKAIVTGDDLGQVASQTIESIFAINEVTTMPILRPLISFDKLDIMEIAHKIDTYDISILPYEDCCTVFVPKEPKTKPKVDECQHNESLIPDLDEMIWKAIQDTVTVACFGDGKEQIRKPFEMPTGGEK
ncbi:MAG: tRNA uracil 4-sulfurtransferase ThiI [Peptococcaceae bacterium]|nr:tRNA uracil 4-sulfurtransferase ThiI [Peptococcaceae bacterium]